MASIARPLTRGMATFGANGRKFFIGGNFKANPATQAEAGKLIAQLNNGAIASSNEVVIAPSQVHIAAFQAGLRKDIGIASQVRTAARATVAPPTSSRE
jgi:triosephosphate isomerase